MKIVHIILIKSLVDELYQDIVPPYTFYNLTIHVLKLTYPVDTVALEASAKNLAVTQV
jgi:hypothetical protein